LNHLREIYKVNLFVTILHVIVCLILILVVLLQAGKGANMGAAFGGSSQTIFGSSGAGTFLGKMTTVVAAIFMLTSLTLSYFSVSKGSSLMDGVSRSQAGKAAPRTAAQKPVVPTDAGKAGAALPATQPGAKK
jgi:preprotein translocase subunit SecG